jgi:hypothetical protein
LHSSAHLRVQLVLLVPELPALSIQLRYPAVQQLLLLAVPFGCVFQLTEGNNSSAGMLA